MKTRVISGLVMAPLLVLVYLGGYWIMGAAFVVGIMGFHEFCKGFEASGAKPCRTIGYAAAVLLYVLHLIMPEGQQYLSVMMWAALVVIASMVYGFNVEERKLEDMTSTLMGIMYTVFLSYHIVLIDEQFGAAIWLVFLTAFGTDIMAYFTGMAIGKHRLCPKLSPKKSVEGAVGGVAGSMILCGIFGALLMKEQMVMCLVIGFFGSIVAQLGDLSASAFKRQMGIKDYGNLIPGHGGILDRFDSVMFTGPAVYYCAVLMDAYTFIQ
ncbi:MAG: phosphatidate cytidylyltransferase [Firmicutes bacterium]|nr:phosphatidate cytidylyltransferase [Bacillota bacterium]